MDLDTVLDARGKRERAKRDYHRALLLALSRLPFDADEIAALMAKEGVRGSRFDCNGCPLAMYLRNATGHIVLVCHDEVACYVNDELHTWPLHETVQQFVSSFDEGEYPGLYGTPSGGRIAHVLRWERVA